MKAPVNTDNWSGSIKSDKAPLNTDDWNGFIPPEMARQIASAQTNSAIEDEMKLEQLTKSRGGFSLPYFGKYSGYLYIGVVALGGYLLYRKFKK